MSTDALSGAVARASAAPERFIAQVQLGSSDRIALLDVPADLTDQELIGLVGSLLTVGRTQLIARRAGARSRLLVPVG